MSMSRLYVFEIISPSLIFLFVLVPWSSKDLRKKGTYKFVCERSLDNSGSCGTRSVWPADFTDFTL